ncbi:MAG TPA: DNA-binding domain-containing protein [Nevskiaceae bacterium]|nr:DNA-binding domain-containing protein [Nevskiaceae bacterium]
MPTAPALPELQRRFLAALYDDVEPGPVETIAGNGLEPAARLRIYRHSSALAHIGALRTSYPAVLALVGEAFFEQTARGYRHANPSDSGNLQGFGAGLGDYLASLPALAAYPYLPDVARLEWLRQQSALAGDTEALAPDAVMRRLATSNRLLAIVLHASVRLLVSRHPVLTIWRYAIQPSPEDLQLDGEGETVVLWREDGEVAMATPDAGSCACIAALMRGHPLEVAHAAATAVDPGFGLAACLESLARQGLIAALQPIADSHEESPPCP